MIALINSGVSNIASVASALTRVGAAFRITNDAQMVRAAKAIVLPGVGAFADGMENLRRHALIEPIRDAARSGVPVLGICLGMQLLADSSEEFGEHRGLGLVPGRVAKLPQFDGLRVPSIGWCDVSLQRKAALFQGIDDTAAFYFVHSYHLACTETNDVVGTIGRGQQRFTVAVERGNVYGAQFHPEKSQDVGLTFLWNFAKLI